MYVLNAMDTSTVHTVCSGVCYKCSHHYVSCPICIVKGDIFLANVQYLIMAELKMLEFRPSVVGMSALWFSIEQLCPSASDAFVAYISKLFINQSQKVIIEGISQYSWFI